MELKANFAKIVGIPKQGRDSWTHVSDGLFLILELTGPSDFLLANQGKKIIDILSQNYQNLPKKNLANIEALVREVRTGEGINLSLILGACLGKVLYLICRGGGKVILKREGKFGTILKQEGSASGILEDKDVFILASPRFWEIVSFEEVKSVFDHFSPLELAEGLTPLVHRVEDTSGVAALVLEYREVQEEWKKDTNEEEFATKEIKNNREALGRRKIFWLAVILVILFGISIVLGLGKKVKTQRESRFSQTYELASHQHEEGKALLGLNNLRATTLLGEAKTSLEDLKKDFSKNSQETSKIEGLLKKIDQGLETASQVYRVAPEVFLDLGLIKEGGEGQKLAIYQEAMVVLDNKAPSLYQINVKSKSAKILGGGEEFQGGRMITIADDAVYVLLDKGIIEIELKIKKTRSEIATPASGGIKIKKDEDWGEIGDLESFAGNLYLLDKTKDQIWKYVSSGSTFLEKTRYLTSGRDQSLQNFSSMAIDGSIWLTTDKILKFSQGREDVFEVKGLEQSLGGNLLIFTSAEVKNLYILDKPNRIVVLEKNGNYKSQYQWEGGNFSDMVISEEEKKIFLLSGNKIYQINLK